MASFWDSAADGVVLKSLVDMFAYEQQDSEAEYGRYAAYRDGTPRAVFQYFAKRPLETEKRFGDRPKLSWPLCPLIVDGHAEARVKGLEVQIDHPETQAAWDAVMEHNDGPSMWSLFAKTSGTYGWTIVRPRIYTDHYTSESHMEFDSFTPLEAKVLYESTGAGSTVRRPLGVRIHTGYSVENGSVFKWPLPGSVSDEMREELGIQQRIELITPRTWKVWLDGKLTPESPHGDIWMPRADGANPFQFCPAVLLNNSESERHFLGESDIRHSVYDVQQVNELWSDVVYMSRMYVPVPTLGTDDVNLQRDFKSGIGTGMVHEIGGSFNFANPQIDFAGAMRPMEVALELTYSNARFPSIAAGLERVYGSAARAVNFASGAAREMDWLPVKNHAEATRRPLTRAVKQLVRNTLRMMASSEMVESSEGELFKLGLSNDKIEADAALSVKYSDEVIPVPAVERLQLAGQEILHRVKSVYQGMIDYNRWTPERAQREMDQIGAEQRSRAAGLPMRDVVELVIDRQEKPSTPAEMSAGEEILFAPVQVPVFDQTDDEKPGGSE